MSAWRGIVPEFRAPLEVSRNALSPPPEYHPPPRTEAWLTLPVGVTVARDDWDYEPWELPEPRRPSPDRLDTDQAFVDEFGLKAGVDWGLVPSPFAWVMRDVFKDSICEQLHQSSRMLLFRESGSDEPPPEPLDSAASFNFTVPIKRDAGC